MLKSAPRQSQHSETQFLKWVSRPAFYLLLILFELLVLSLPLFPTGDGGLHLYYAAILRDLVTHHSPAYAHYYAVRHLVQPYLLHYYALMTLETFVSQDAAEKIIIMVNLAVVAFGFRRLVNALSPAASGLSLLIFPFLLNWPLAMGAVNYNIAIGLMFFAIAEYLELRDPGSTALRFGRFAILLLLLVLSHPVPLLLLLCIIAVDLLLRWRDTRFTKNARPLRPFLFGFGATALALLIPMLIVDKSRLGTSVNDTFFHVGYLRIIFNTSRLSMFFHMGIVGKLYSRSFLILLPLSWVLVLRSGFLERLRARTCTAADRLAAFSVLFLVASLFAPSSLNGSGYFSERLWLPCWLLGIVAAAPAVASLRLNLWAASIGIVLAALSLFYAERTLQPVARMQAELEHADLPNGQTGILLQTKATESGGAPGAQYPLFWWSGARAFAAHRDVLLNSAWLYLTIIPVRENGRAGLMRDYVPDTATEDPNNIARYLVNHPQQRQKALAQADFVVLMDPVHFDPGAITRFFFESDLPNWHCEMHDYFSLCTRPKAQASPSAG